MILYMDIDRDPVLSVFLDVVGDVAGLNALDAGCGVGLLEDRGHGINVSRVTGDGESSSDDRADEEEVLDTNRRRLLHEPGIDGVFRNVHGTAP